jgi:cyanophycinase
MLAKLPPLAFGDQQRLRTAMPATSPSPLTSPLMRTARLLPAAAITFVLACAPSGRVDTASEVAGTPRVGPASGSVVVVGGGSQGREVFAKFIELAGGPDALIVDVPTAGGDSTYPADGGRGLRAAGARNVIVLHTKDRRIADADSFVARIANARGIWFGGGRHYHLVDAYAGTKTQKAFEAVLARGGVVGGSSAGASILGSYLVRGAPSSNNRIMSHPAYLVGFGYLRGVAVDQHVVARERLPDLHDSVTSKRRDLFGISEDEGTAWVIRGDTGEIIGRNKAFVYNGRDPNDKGKPFLTLRPGDRYDLGARRVMSRAITGSSLTQAFVDKLFDSYKRDTARRAAVLVAQNGKVLVNSAYNVPIQRRFTPETGAPVFPLLGLSNVLNAALPTASTGSRFAPANARRVLTIGGMQRAIVDSTTGQWIANVDDLYRFHMARSATPSGDSMAIPSVRNLIPDVYRGLKRESAYGTDDGRRNAWMYFPDKGTFIVVLTTDNAANARYMAEQIADRLFVR